LYDLFVPHRERWTGEPTGIAVDGQAGTPGCEVGQTGGGGGSQVITVGDHHDDASNWEFVDLPGHQRSPRQQVEYALRTLVGHTPRPMTRWRCRSHLSRRHHQDTIAVK
jgi:hypothetical protein